MPRLIVSGDDLGLDPQIDAGIEKAHREGILTSASLVANGRNFDSAVQLIKRNPGLGIGLHINFLEEKPLCDPREIPNLVTRSGTLRVDQNRIALDAMMGRVRQSEFQAECRAQLERCASAGILLTHVDSHRHLHMMPPIFRAIRPVLDEFGIKRMRYLSVRASEYRLNQLLKVVVSSVFRILYGQRRYRSPKHFIGFFQSGGITESDFLKIIPTLGNNVYEIGMHPGMNNADIRKHYGHWGDLFGYEFSWEAELKALVSPMVKEGIKARGVELINYGDL